MGEFWIYCFLQAFSVGWDHIIKTPLRPAKTRYDPLIPATTRYGQLRPATTRYDPVRFTRFDIKSKMANRKSAECSNFGSIVFCRPSL